ncbi:MAG: alginate lyase family protein [Acidobacteria bacterium]|nr:alginate lyase family protein [Acidobacteriota bacterium]
MVERTLEKLKKLRGMPANEMAYRIRDRLRCETDRLRFHWNGVGTPEESFSDKHGFSFKQYLQEGPAQRFYLPAIPEEREGLKEFANTYFPEWREKAVEEAERLRQHRVELLGYGEIELGRDIDWHQDPITGQIWPRRYWADYDLVRDAGAGDPKVIHELNRHQHLPRLAKAYFLTGEEKYAREAIEQIKTWIAQNPPGSGINWHSSLEISLRVLSWLWTLFFILPAESFDEDAALSIGGSLLAQLDHVHRYPSVFSSPNTHLIGEATALFIGGLIFSECKHAPAWQKQGASLLIAEMKKQILREGIHGELSSYYHCYTLDFYLQALILASRNRFSFPNRVWRRSSRMLDFLMHLTRPDGSIPLLGDDDGGRALALNQTNYRSFRDGLCTGAVLFHRPDYKHQAGEFCEETFWMLGEPAWQTYLFLEKTPPLESSASFPAAGYFIQRSDWSNLASHLIFDCGGIGIINGGHGHADSLSVVLSAGGKELLVDPGTYTYNTAPEWRNFFRSTVAHNTALVDGQDQSEAGETFRWRQVAQSRRVKQLADAGIEYIEGEHNGYERLPQQVVHRRRLLYCKPDYWMVIDDFRGEGKHNFDLYYHFSPDAKLSFDGSDRLKPGMEIRALVPGAGLRLFLCASVPLKAEIVSGQSTPIQGWVSSRYGKKKPALTLRVSFCSPVPAAIVSILVPFVADSGSPASWQDQKSCEISGLKACEQAIACTVKNQSRNDLMVFSLRDSELEVSDCKMRGELFWLHTDRDILKQFFALNAHSLEYNGQTVFQNSDPMDFVWHEICEETEAANVEPAELEMGEMVYVRDMRNC